MVFIDKSIRLLLMAKNIRLYNMRNDVSQVIMGIFTLAALIFIIVCIVGEKSALPGNGVLLVRRHFFETRCTLVWTKYASGNNAILKCMLVSLSLSLSIYIYIYIYEDRENPQLMSA